MGILPQKKWAHFQIVPDGQVPFTSPAVAFTEKGVLYLLTVDLLGTFGLCWSSNLNALVAKTTLQKRRFVSGSVFFKLEMDKGRLTINGILGNGKPTEVDISTSDHAAILTALGVRPDHAAKAEGNEAAQ